MGFKTQIAKIIILLIITINGCVYESPVNNYGNVQGKILSSYSSFPLYDYNVALNTAPIVVPNAYGEFFFENVTTPYDLNAFLRLCTSGVTIFKNVRNHYPVLVCGGFSRGLLFKVIIRVKDYNWQKNTVSKFISKCMFEESSIRRSEAGNDLIIKHEIYSPLTENTIYGKFIIFECTTTSLPHHIISIDNYAEKSYTVGLNSNDTLVFEREDFNFNPSESNVVVRIENNPNIYDSYTNIYIDFSDYYHDSKFYLNSYDTKQNLTYDFMVPESLPINFEIRTENRSSQIQDSLYISINKWIYLNPTEYGEINYNSSFGLLHPENNQMNVGRITKFIIHDEEPGGIYNFIIKAVNTYEDFEIFTDSKEIILPHLDNLGFTFIPDTEYEWYVEKYTNFENIDDFVSSPYNERIENGSIIESERRKFKTSPNY